MGNWNKSTHTVPGKMHTQKRCERTMSLKNWLITGLPCLEPVSKGWGRDLLFPVPKSQQEITRHTKKQQTIVHSEESPETNPNKTQTSNLRIQNKFSIYAQ